jgi:carboxymethylenebutenolidase
MLTDIDQRQVVLEDVRLPNGAPAVLGRPVRPGRYPAIVLLHERYGVVQHTRDLAIRLATEGLVALAPNLWFREPNLDAIERGEIRPEVPDAQVAADIGVSLDYLAQIEDADTTHVAVWGACATGRYPLVAAAERPDVAACVIFYGAAYQRDWEPDRVTPFVHRSRAPVLCVFGEFDHLVARERVLLLRNVLEAARRSYHVKVSPGAYHAFLDDVNGVYSRPHAEAAWRLLISFLDRVRAGGYPADRVQWTFDVDYPIAYDFPSLAEAYARARADLTQPGPSVR